AIDRVLRAAEDVLPLHEDGGVGLVFRAIGGEDELQVRVLRTLVSLPHDLQEGELYGDPWPGEGGVVDQDVVPVVDLECGIAGHIGTDGVVKYFDGADESLVVTQGELDAVKGGRRFVVHDDFGNEAVALPHDDVRGGRFVFVRGAKAH